MTIVVSIVSPEDCSISILLDNKIIYFKRLKTKNNKKKYLNLIIEEAKYITRIKKNSLKLLCIYALKKKYIFTELLITICNSFIILLNLPLILISGSELTYNFLNKKKFSTLLSYKNIFSINSRLLCYFIFLKKMTN